MTLIYIGTKWNLSFWTVGRDEILIDTEVSKVKFLDTSTEKRTETNRIPLVITYHSLPKDFVKFFNKHLHILCMNDEVRKSICPWSHSFILGSKEVEYLPGEGTTLFPRNIVIIRNGKIVWKVVWIEYYLRLNVLVPEDTSTQPTSSYIKCKYWMSRKVGMVKTTVFFICEQPFGALMHLNFFILILICF